MGRRPLQPQPTPLRAPHHSVRGKLRKPHDMSCMTLPLEVREAVENLVLEIFTDMANAGYPFHECLAAIYVSGISHAIEIGKEEATVNHEQKEQPVEGR